MPARSTEDYQIAWICALPKELTAARAMLDEEHESLPTRAAQDANTYILGEVYNHNVVIACLPVGVYGTNSAAVVVINLLRTFTNVRMGLMVGIGGGIPNLDQGVDIRLGDVVVSQPDGTHGGVVQYDLRKNLGAKVFERKGALNRPPSVLLGAVSRLQSNHQMSKSQMAESISHAQQRFPSLVEAGFIQPDLALDVLHFSEPDARDATEPGVQCVDKLVPRKPRSHRNPEVHYGTIASGNELMKNASERDRLGRELGAKCVEMEAAGFMNELPCLVVRGICDYADQYKNDGWQEYAAITASAYAKELLSLIPPVESIGDTNASRTTARVSQRFPFPRNDDVVIRPGIFSKLEQLLPLKSQAQSAVLWGLGGSGKTQIALEFAYRRHLQHHYLVFWVHASSYSQFFEGYRQIAEYAGLSSTLQGSELLKAVRSWLESQSDWLLVLDNADDLSLFGLHQPNTTANGEANVLPFVPCGSNGSILWTTRDERAVGHVVGVSRGVNVKDMTPEEARELLISLSGIAETDNTVEFITAILVHLECLPLAISQAAAFIRVRNVSYQHYLVRLSQERKRWRILAEDGSKLHRIDGVPNNVMKTWQVTVDYLEHTHSLAYWIMMVIVYFHNQAIPWSLIRTVGLQKLQATRAQKKSFDHNSENEDLSEDDDSDAEEDEVRAAISRLAQFSLVRVRSDDAQDLQSYNIHKLVQDATRRAIWQDGRRYNQPLEPLPSVAALYALTQAFPSGKYGTWNECARLLTHVQNVRQLSELTDQKSEMHNMLSSASYYLMEQARWTEAEDILIEILNTIANVLGEDHPSIIGYMANLAITYDQQGRSSEAEEVKVKAIGLGKEILEESHPDVVTAMAHLAKTYLDQGRLNEAEELRVEVLGLRNQVLGEKHPDTVSSMADLAVVYVEQGRLSEAEKLQVKALGLLKQASGKSYHSAIKYTAYLPVSYANQGRLIEAEKVQVEILELQKRVFGEKHPSTIRSMANLTALYSYQGQFSEAEKLQVEVLGRTREIYGEQHPNTIREMADLGLTYHRLRRLDEAEKLQIAVLKICQDVRGDKDPETIAAMLELATTYFVQQRFVEAEKMLQKIWVVSKEVLGDKHPNTIRSMDYLGVMYSQNGRLDEAENLQLAVLRLEREIRGDKHPDTITSMSNLEITYFRQHRLSEAEKLMREVLALRTEVLGDEHPDTKEAQETFKAHFPDSSTSDVVEM